MDALAPKSNVSEPRSKTLVDPSTESGPRNIYTDTSAIFLRDEDEK